MANFALNNSMAGTQQNITTTYKSQLSAVANTTGTSRGKVYDFLVGTNGTPADNAVEWSVAKQTANGIASTFTNATPLALDNADAAASAWGGVNYTTEPTANGTANSVFYIGLNQRASYRWVAAPGGELVWPATAWSGFVIMARSPVYASTVTAHLWFQEQ